jgi:DNA-binding transcriptional ArsR family regulator
VYLIHVVKLLKEQTVSLPAKELNFSQIKPLTSKLAQRILSLLAEKPLYPKAIAKELSVNEQKVYYHIRNLEAAGIVEVSKSENVGGAIANFYSLTFQSFVIKYGEWKVASKIQELEEKPRSFMEPFIEDGTLNAVIIVGSPDPHGPEKARSRDGYYGIDLSLFMGTFLNYVPDLNVKLDTEVRTEDLEKNLILIGGPVVNSITERINNQLPIKFIKEENWKVKSSISGREYLSDEIGIVVKIKNPFNPKKYILLVAGKRHTGTRAVIIAFIKHFSEVIKGNSLNPKLFARVVEGVDLNSDGMVDDVEFQE